MLRNLDVVRDFVHVDDVVEALVRLAFVDRDLSGCRIVNVSTGQGASVREMARTARRITGGLDSEFPIVESGEENEEHKEGISEVIVDNRLLRALTGWTPQISLEHGLRKAVNVLQDEGQRLSS